MLETRKVSSGYFGRFFSNKIIKNFFMGLLRTFYVGGGIDVMQE